MNNSNESNALTWARFQEIRYNMSKASLQELETILNNYNQGPVVINGVNYHYNVNPLEAACLNARYQELTGENHPRFVSEQTKVLDEFIKSEPEIRINGKPGIYQRLKNNLTGKEPGICILPSRKESFISKFEKIQYDISKASLDDVKDILDYYDQESVLINGAQYHFTPTVFQGASLNGRYKELTGEDHPVFIVEQERRLNEIMRSPEGRASTIYKKLKNNAIEIGGQDHILNKTHKIILEPENASLEDISSLLDYYNGDPVLIDGILSHPFNDPISATKLNSIYQEATGQIHPVYAEQVPKVIKNRMRDKNQYIKAGVFDNAYFDRLNEILDEVKGTDRPKEEEDQFPRIGKTKFSQIFEKTKGKTKGIISDLKTRFGIDNMQEKSNDDREM